MSNLAGAASVPRSACLLAHHSHLASAYWDEFKSSINQIRRPPTKMLHLSRLVLPSASRPLPVIHSQSSKPPLTHVFVQTSKRSSTPLGLLIGIVPVRDFRDLLDRPEELSVCREASLSTRSRLEPQRAPCSGHRVAGVHITSSNHSAQKSVRLTLRIIGALFFE